MPPKIYAIHENAEWFAPLRSAFEELSLPFEEWFLDQGVLDFSTPPPPGVFYNRMSASSHTRGHRYAPEYTSTVLAWLDSHGPRVVNNSRALQLEINKIAQYAALRNFGIRTPRTFAALGKDNLIKAAAHFNGPFITKHNRAGKGLGVRLFQSQPALRDYVLGGEFDDSVDGVSLIQEYIRAPEPFITRVEFIGGKFFYAVQVDTSLGFQLCPADVCEIGDAFCPVGTAPAVPTPATAAPRFRILPGFDHPILGAYKKFLAHNGSEIAGIEFVTDTQGELYTYDVNTNTNYNSAAEAQAQTFGMKAVARFLGRELHKLSDRNQPALAALAAR